ncbi:hypothetical protein [Pseudonocardia sp.]|uniref:hypothetical protein n=1 Tax=Pseudonocardia sp. TaxID=60912 RepID=UPI003D10D732
MSQQPPWGGPAPRHPGTWHGPPHQPPWPPAPPGQPYGHPAPGGPPPPRKRSRALPVVAVLLLVVAAGAIGAFLLLQGAGAQAPSSTPAGVPATAGGAPGVPRPAVALTQEQIDAVCSGDTQAFACEGGVPTPEQQCAAYPDTCTLPPGQRAPSRAVQECRAILGADNPACDDLDEPGAGGG